MQNRTLSPADIKRVVEGSGVRLSNAAEPAVVAQNLRVKNEESVIIRRNPSPFYKGMRVEALKVVDIVICTFISYLYHLVLFFTNVDFWCKTPVVARIHCRCRF